jgi:hypothetical protein
MRKTIFNLVAGAIIASLPGVAVAGSKVSTDGPKWPAVVTMTGDLDIYDKPDGAVISVFKKGKKVTIQKCQANNWCETSAGWIFASYSVGDLNAR